MNITAVKNISNIPFNSYKLKQVNKENTLLFPEQNDSFYMEKLEDYSFAKGYYNKKLDTDGKLFNDSNSLQEVLGSKKATQNLFFFFRDRAEQELLELNSKPVLTQEEKEKIEGLKEIVQAFPSINSYQSNQPISFTGVVSPEDKIKCHLAIHGASAACGALSAAMGEGAALGADTPFLWGTQALMFTYLKNLLGVDTGAHIQYMGRQYVMGAYIGIKGAKYICNWLGIGGHAATGGAGSAAITGAVRGVNGTLSTALTEKMGWGYVSSYQNDRMTWKKQLIQNAIYAVGMGIFGKPSDDILDPTNINDVSDAMKSIPKKNILIYGSALQTLYEHVNLPRAGFMFVASLVQGAITCKSKDEETKKKDLIIILSSALLNSVIYELLNLSEDSCINDEATVAINKLGHELKENPEVFAEFTKCRQELMDKINVDNLDTRDFIKQFKDKKFTYNTAILASDLTTMIADRWRKRNFGAIKQQGDEANKGLRETNKQTDKINNLLSDEDKVKLNEDVESMIDKCKTKIKERSKSNFALGKIGGYDNIKASLSLLYIDPIKNNKNDYVPNSILFYGPSGTGKSTIGLATAEEAGVRFKAKSIGLGDEKEIFDWIVNNAKIAEENFRKTGRYTIIQLNEIDDYASSNKELLKEFTELLEDCAKKYHCTFFLTTNNPLTIDKNILDKTIIRLPIGAANRNDIQEIVEHYIGEKNIENLDYNEVVEKFECVKPDFAYSNSQIENIIVRRLPKNKCTQKDFLNIIENTKPCIDKKIMKEFEKEQKILNGEL